MSYTQIDDALWAVRERVQAKTGDMAQTDRALTPLVWYISTGRAPTDFLRLLTACTSRQLTTIAGRLIKHSTGDYNDAINSVCQCIGYNR